MRYLAVVALAASLCGHATSVAAQIAGSQAAASGTSTTPKAVVELFTSQGCSSCPAADALLGKLANRADIVALSLSVDYWDYLGWKDTLASAKFTERQRAYAEARRDGMVYTPQAVVNGLMHVNGGDEGKITRAIEKATNSPSGLQVPIRMSSHDGKLVVEAGAAPVGVTIKEATLWLAVVTDSVEVPIRRGENEGKTITYHNVVRELMPIGMWDGKSITVQLEHHTFMSPVVARCAVLLQQGRAGPIIGAALLRHF